MDKPYVLTWMQRITLEVDLPPWYQRIFGYKKTTTRWVKFGVKLKGIDPEGFALAFETNGIYDKVCLERKETPAPYIAGNFDATVIVAMPPGEEDERD